MHKIIGHRPVDILYQLGQVNDRLFNHFVHLSREGFPLIWLHTLGIAQRLQTLKTFVWLYALHVVVPLLTRDRSAGVEEPAGAKHRIEVGFGAVLYSLLGSLGCLIEAKAILRLDVLADVEVGEGCKQE